jgi:hypothetical protein
MAQHHIKLTTDHKDEVTPDPDQLTDIDRKESREVMRKVKEAPTQEQKIAILKEFLQRNIKNIKQWNETKTGNL